MKKSLLLISFILFSFISQAQKNKVSGTLLDEKKTALPFANVLLMKAKDSTLAKAASSDLNGKFIIENISETEYFLKISMVGYENYYSPKFIINNENKELDFKRIELVLATQQLGEVNVVAKKPFIEQQIDKTVLNVENSIVASGNTALEVLEKAPGVVIDHQNDKILLKNKSGVLVMIDGKRSYMSEADLNQYLRNMPSDQIASIEIITNPSSKYDASGNSGIINIKLKKNKSFGTNGTYSATAGTALIPNSTSDLYRLSNNLSLNHRIEKWNVYGTGNAYRSSWFNDTQLNRKVNSENSLYVFDQKSTRIGHGIGGAAKFGLDYFANKKTTYGIMIDANIFDGKMTNSSKTLIDQQLESANVKSSVIQNSNINLPSESITGNFNIQSNLNDKGKELSVNVDYSKFWNHGDTYFTTDFLDQNNNLTSNILQRNITPSSIDIYAAKIDYTLPLKKEVKLEMGLKSGYVITDNNFQFDFRADDKWNPDLGKTNTFVYKENVNAAYFNVGKQWKKVGLQAGLRAENTNSNGNSKTLNKEVKRNYLDLFPTLFINQELAKDHAMRYSYSRRIDRPNYQQLNPFLFFLDPYTFEEGNPFLQPQYTDNFELNYTYKGSMSVGLGYSNTHDYMIQITSQNDSTRITKAFQTNLKSFENYSLNLSSPLPIRKWWMTQNSFSLYYNQFKDPNLLETNLNVGQIAFNFYTSSTITLPKKFSAEISMWYNSPNVYGIIKNTKPQYAVNAGVQKSFKDKKSKLKLNANDLFLTSFFNGYVNYKNMDLSIKSRWTSRRVSLTYTYNFGNQNVKSARKRSTAADTEKNRVGGNQN